MFGNNKQLHIDYPIIIQERDQLKIHLQRVQKECDTLEQHINAIVSERDHLKEYLSDLDSENSKLAAKLEQTTSERDQLLKYKTWAPPGHFYSPIPSIEDLKRREETIFDRSNDDLLGIDLNLEEHFELLSVFQKYYSDIPFKYEKVDQFRYYFNNSFYSYTDGVILYCILRHFQPKK